MSYTPYPSSRSASTNSSSTWTTTASRPIGRTMRAALELPVRLRGRARVCPARTGPGRAGRGHRRGLPAVAASNRAVADHSRGRAESRAGDHRRDRRRHVPVPDRRPSGRLGRVGAGDERSAGRKTPAGKRHGNKWLTAMLVEAAGSVGRMHGKNYLAAQHARLTSGAGWVGPRSRSRTRSWCRPTGC